MHEETSVFEPQKLFYQDAYLKECQAYVESCEEGKDGFMIVLNQTVFFPEGGGQPSDQGVLKCKDGSVVTVLEVKEKGKIFHICDKAIAVGEEVLCKINWERRFDYMQQHSGEHIFSGFMHERFGFENVGFHISEASVTVDFSGVCSFEEVKEIEKKTNQYIWENHVSNVFYPSKEELDNLEYRSKMEIAGQVRLVEYPGADLCACCGTHVASTGEIGFVKILSCVNWRGGIRVEMACGRWAFEYAEKIQEQNSLISVKLSAKVFETATAVDRVMNESFVMKGKLAELEQKALTQLAQEYKGNRDVTIFDETLSPENARKLCDMIISESCGICRVFAGNDTDGYKYAIGEVDGDLREFVKKMNTELNGRGGGKPFFVQGSVAAKRAEIEAFLKKL